MIFISKINIIDVRKKTFSYIKKERGISYIKKNDFPLSKIQILDINK